MEDTVFIIGYFKKNRYKLILIALFTLLAATVKVHAAKLGCLFQPHNSSDATRPTNCPSGTTFVQLFVQLFVS